LFSIQPCPIPDDALLGTYRTNGAYADCYAADIVGTVPHEQFVTAFYTTFVFKLERMILEWAVSMPSTDTQAEQLASGAIDAFAAWHVERRCENQLLMSDFRGRTRSWLMVSAFRTDSGPGTRLYFGSAVVPVRNAGTGRSTFGSVFRVLLGFHKIYSRVLLYAARSRLNTQRI
jgi:hypothetical protein